MASYKDTFTFTTVIDQIQKNRTAKKCSENGQQQSTTQKILNGRPQGERTTARSRLRLLADVNGLRHMLVKIWRKMAEDRREKPVIVREAKVRLKRTIQPM
jgi:hypothetical protein